VICSDDGLWFGARYLKCRKKKSLDIFVSAPTAAVKGLHQHLRNPFDVQIKMSKKFTQKSYEKRKGRAYPEAADVVGVYAVCLMAACITIEGELLLPTPKVAGIIEGGPEEPLMFLLIIGPESLDTGKKFVTGTCLKKNKRDMSRKSCPTLEPNRDT